MNEICPMCEEGSLTPSTYTGTLHHKNKIIEIEGLECSVCSACHAEILTFEQAVRNQEKRKQLKNSLV